MKPFAQIGQAALYHADALEVADVVGDDKIDVVICSPPYNLKKVYGDGIDDNLPYVDYLEWTTLWLEEITLASADDARLCLNVPLDITTKDGKDTIRRPVGADILDLARSVGWSYHGTVIWDEGNVNKRTAWGSYAMATAPYEVAPVELVLILYKGPRWKREALGRTSTIDKEDFKKWTIAHWRIPGESAKRVKHPAPFPEELPRRLMQLYSFKEDRIGDPFLGSGTTCKVANDLGRRSIGLEIERDHLRTSTIRLAKARGQQVLFDADGVMHIQGALAA